MGCPALAPAETEASTSPSHRSAPAVRRLVLPHADAQSRRSGPPRQHVPVAAPPKWPERRLPGTQPTSKLVGWSALSSRWTSEDDHRGSVHSLPSPKCGVGDLVEAARQHEVGSGQARSTASRMRSRRIGASRVVRCRTAWSTPRSRTPRLQGVSPLMSPLRHIAVSSDTSLAPPMGFVPLRGSLDSRRRLLVCSELPNGTQACCWLAPRSGHRGESRWRLSRHPSGGCSAPSACVSGLAALRGGSGSRRGAFSASSGCPVTCPGVPTAEAATTTGASPSESVRVSKS